MILISRCDIFEVKSSNYRTKDVETLTCKDNYTTYLSGIYRVISIVSYLILKYGFCQTGATPHRSIE